MCPQYNSRESYTERACSFVTNKEKSRNLATLRLSPRRSGDDKWNNSRPQPFPRAKGPIQKKMDFHVRGLPQTQT
ncbi:hypothetical protein NPIL_161921 [Nephila pilipes]|uniref:Uncharacterized protein n=1 Tax=Nephila pilipes TaxID=299642 RepID=A0A8X6P3W1_NEPPI|nr:hypothetical protein NPIL_161921 [Nephila pilipes]